MRSELFPYSIPLRTNSYLTEYGLYISILDSKLLLWTNRACVFLFPRGESNYIARFGYWAASANMG